MNKDQLKQYITDLRLEAELEELIFELIDGAEEVNQTLLNTVADILENQADFYENVAKVLDQEADEYEALGEAVQALDAEEQEQRLQAIFDSQDQLLKELTDKVNEHQGAASTTQDETAPQASSASQALSI